MLLPRLRPLINDFRPNEVCYMLHAYNEIDYVPKQFASECETIVKQYLYDAEKVKIEDLALIARVFCKARTASRNFHKLLETTILMRMPDLRKELKLIHQLGLTFEETGLCSIDTLKALKKEAFQVEVEEEQFK